MPAPFFPPTSAPMPAPAPALSPSFPPPKNPGEVRFPQPCKWGLENSTAAGHSRSGPVTSFPCLRGHFRD